MGNRNINSTSYVHNDEPNTNDVTKAMDYNAVTDENDLVDNANTGGLKVGRPWAT
jgi:hypothetical protein